MFDNINPRSICDKENHLSDPCFENIFIEDNELLSKIKEKFVNKLEDFNEPWDKIITKANENDELNRFRKIGSYPAYLDLYYSKHVETTEEKEHRIICNYLRHVVLPYDETFSVYRDDLLVSKNLVLKVWVEAMEAIVNKYPCLVESYNKSFQLKKEWFEGKIVGGITLKEVFEHQAKHNQKSSLF